MFSSNSKRAIHIMANTKRRLYPLFIIIVVMLTLPIFTLTANATSHSENGLTVNISTDKEQYTANETANVNIEIKNDTDFDFDDVGINNIIPEELKSSEETTFKGAIKAHDKVTLSFKINENVTPANVIPATTTDGSQATTTTTDGSQATTTTTDGSQATTTTSTVNVTNTQNNNDKIDSAPKTGENFQIMPFIVGGISLILALVLCKNRKVRKFGSKFLCLFVGCAILVQAVPLNIFAVERQQKSFEVEYTISFADKNYILKTFVQYYLPNTIIPEITINTSDFEQFDYSGEKFLITEPVDLIDGLVTGNKDLESLSIDIFAGKLELVHENLELAEDWQYLSPPLIVGENTVTVTAKTKYGIKTKKTINILNSNDKNAIGLDLDTNDNDGDGLLNWEENFYGSDIENPDTDGDKLTDYQEAKITRTDPILPDTNFNSISDADEDLDQDELTHIQEVQTFGTDPLNSDPDADDLSDYEEVMTYMTDPHNPDTDGDKANDGNEVKYGTDPLIFNESFTITESTAEINEANPVQATVTLNMTGNQVGTLDIVPANAADDIRFTQTIPGYLGTGFDFYIEGTFNTAEMSFEYDTALGEIGETFQPRIYYFNEETGELEELPDQTVVNGKVTATVNHFSKYILLNKVEFDLVWLVDIRPPVRDEESDESIDLIFVIDESGS
ncbi:MAG: thrombospondin type 3 repeat-containing protein, partial [Oscillospiraceae bacterium]|nr:thrombospondin type 3 repeat-containing protein [Oscillospiraceae bacterium]